MINIIDNFLDQEVLKIIEKEIDKNKFKEFKTPGKSFWVQEANTYLVRYILTKLEIEEGYDLESVKAFFREAKKDQDNDWRIHCDFGPNTAEANRACVLYINQNITDGLNGTAFWDHTKHGHTLEYGDLKEYNRILLEDSEDLSKWKLQSVIGSKKNRLLSYPTNYFHSKYPNEFDESRVVFVMFYKIKK